MPGTAAKKHEEGTFMKKIVKGILLLVVTGCSRIGMGGAAEPTENSVYVAGDGSVRWASVETYQQGDYTEDELKTWAGQKISDFNSGLGKAASYENTEGSEKLPAAMVSARIGNGTATLVTEYDTPGRLIEFAQEIGDYNVPFTQLDTGRLPCPVNLRMLPLRMRRGRQWTRRQPLRTDRTWWSRPRGRVSS